eukprot:2041661-Rhodomonas_salina.2
MLPPPLPHALVHNTRHDRLGQLAESGRMTPDIRPDIRSGNPMKQQDGSTCFVSTRPLTG